VTGQLDPLAKTWKAPDPLADPVPEIGQVEASPVGVRGEHQELARVPLYRRRFEAKDLSVIDAQGLFGRCIHA
jgi:hypothetical protein